MPSDARVSIGCSDYASPGQVISEFTYAVSEVLIRDAAAYCCVLLGYLDRSYLVEVKVDDLCDLERSSGSFASTFGLVPVPRP